MLQSLGICKTCLTAIMFGVFFFGFWSLGLWPFMLFLGATFSLAILDWTNFQDEINIFNTLYFLLLGGSMTCLLYYAYTYFLLKPEIAAYPFVVVWIHDSIKFLVQSFLSQSTQSYKISFDKRLIGMLCAAAGLSGFNWYFLDKFNPLAYLNFPINYYAIFGFSAICSIAIVLGRALMLASLGGDHDHQDTCPPASAISFANLYGSYLLFAYLIALISFGKNLINITL